MSWAKHSHIPEFVKVAGTIDRYRQLLLNTRDYGLSNARSEATNIQLRALTKHAYGFTAPKR
ncbi:MAG: transposase [Mycobacterium sp.]